MKEESLIKPVPIKGITAKRALLMPFDSSQKTIGKRVEKKAYRRIHTEGSTIYLLNRASVLYGGLGASNTVLFMERFIASGIEEIILLGVCGSLSPSLRTFDAAVIQEAHAEEGTSFHYFPSRQKFLPSAGLNSEVETVLREEGLFYHTSSIVSTDAPYRETLSWLQDKKNRKIDAVDMETSAVFSVSEYHGIRAASLQVVSDELFSGEWKSGFGHEELDCTMERYFMPFIDWSAGREST